MVVRITKTLERRCREIFHRLLIMDTTAAEAFINDLHGCISHVEEGKLTVMPAPKFDSEGRAGMVAYGDDLVLFLEEDRELGILYAMDVRTSAEMVMSIQTGPE